jgi:hypothetical protein
VRAVPAVLAKGERAGLAGAQGQVLAEGEESERGEGMTLLLLGKLLRCPWCGRVPQEVDYEDCRSTECCEADFYGLAPPQIEYPPKWSSYWMLYRVYKFLTWLGLWWLRRKLLDFECWWYKRKELGL